MTVDQITNDLRLAQGKLQLATDHVDAIVASSDDTSGSKVRKLCAAVEEFHVWLLQQIPSESAE